MLVAAGTWLVLYKTWQKHSLPINNITHSNISYNVMLSQDFSQSTGNPAYLAHLTDIWIILTHICVFIFCSMWLEKTFRYHWGSCSPKLNHSPPEDVVKYCGLIIFADLILSSCRQWNLLQRKLASWNNLQIFCSSLHPFFH